MVNLQNRLQRVRVLPDLLRLIPAGSSCQLVGGALRDALLGRVSLDFDFTAAGDPTSLAKAFARAIQGHWFLLDRQRAQSRVLCTIEGEAISYDFAPWRGPTLEDDLRGRDFTLNALAWRLAPKFDWAQVYDPLGGRADLAHGLLRGCSAQSFSDDPLRVLRGVRLGAQFELAQETSTLVRMRTAGKALERVAAERIRQELAAIFAAGELQRSLMSLAELELSEMLLGPVAPDRLSTGLTVVATTESALNHWSARANPLALPGAEHLVDGFSRTGMFKLAALLRVSAAASQVPSAVRRWRWSRKGLRLLQDLLALPQDVASELRNLPRSLRGQALWVANLGSLPLECLSFLWLSSGLDARVGQSLRSAWESYRQVARSGRVPDLVPAEWVQATLGLDSGSKLGQMLDLVRQAELEGRIISREEAENLLKSIGEKSIDKGSGPPL